MSVVKVKITGTGGGGYQREIVVEAPLMSKEEIEEWWQEVIFPHTGSGKGGHDFCEAVVTMCSHVPAFVGYKTSWEG